jgi:hypothetical protein
MPANTAINGCVTRPDGGRSPVLEEVAAGARRTDRSAGRSARKLPELTPGPRGQRPPGSLIEFPSRQPARLEVLAQVGHDLITVGIGRPHRSACLTLADLDWIFGRGGGVGAAGRGSPS